MYYIKEIFINPANVSSQLHLNDIQPNLILTESGNKIFAVIYVPNLIFNCNAMFYTDTTAQKNKRKCDCEFYSTKIRKLDEENKKLKELCEEQNKKHVEELEKQTEIFHILLKKEKEIMQKKLNANYLKSKLLIRKTKRRNKKIQNLSSLLKNLKEKNLISQTTFETLHQQFSNSCLPIIKNEFSNRGKSMHARRYSDDTKTFAATLYYHSPKAYNFCRSVFSSFISIFDYIILIFIVIYI